MRKKRLFASFATVLLGLSAMSFVSVTEARDRPGRSPPEPPQAVQGTDHVPRLAPTEGGTGDTRPVEVDHPQAATGQHTPIEGRPPPRGRAASLSGMSSPLSRHFPLIPTEGGTRPASGEIPVGQRNKYDVWTNLPALLTPTLNHLNDRA
jgi:hypothetical protein